MSQKHKDAGAKGGKATREKYGLDHLREIGERGGARTARIPGHMRRAGKIGFRVTVQRHWKGDVEAYKAFLFAQAQDAKIGQLVSYPDDVDVGQALIEAMGLDLPF